MNREFAIEWRKCQWLRRNITLAPTLPERIAAIVEYQSALLEFANHWEWELDRIANRYAA